MRRILFALILAIAPALVVGATKYVSPTGTALWAACTTSATPCALSTAVSNAAAGDVVVLMDGTYSTGINTSAAGSAGNPVTWRAQNNRKAILAGLASGATGNVIQADAAYHTFDGLVVAVQTGTGSADTFGLFSSGGNIIFKNGEIYYAGDQVVIAPYHAICAELRALTTFTNNYVHNCTIGVQFYANGAAHASQVTNNTLKNMDVGLEEDSDCFNMNGSVSASWVGAVLYNNECSGWRDDGFDAFNQDDMTVTDNYFHDPLLTVKLNTTCLKLGYETSSGVTARRNRCLGLGKYAAQKDWGLYLVGASSTLNVANVFQGGYIGAEIAQRNSAGGSGNLLYNNDFIGFSAYAVIVKSGTTGTVLTNNYVDGAAATFGDINVNSGVTATGSHNLRRHGTDGGAGTYNKTGDIDGDIQFTVGAGIYGFQLKPSSPAIGAGVFVGPYTDNLGHRYREPPAIGAYEQAYGSVVSSRSALTKPRIVR